MPTPDDSDARGSGGVDEPVAEPTVRQLLLNQIDEDVKVLGQGLDHVRTLTEQLHPELARACQNAITMASVMVDEIRLRAHARPLDSDDD